MWRFPRDYPLDWPLPRRSALSPLGVNELCFIRKEHECGKVLGASKSCFVACPTDDSLETVLELISEKLTKVGVEPIIAIKERAYGQDIFCTKICGRIIESRFCIVILDDTAGNGVPLPNPNVYYEYGLMTSLRKHIIPLQREDLKLAFNIQSYDTIKYGPRNIGAELDRAVRDALKITGPQEREVEGQALSDKTLLRRAERAGLEIRGRTWFLADVIDDTQFRGFSHSEKRFYLYLGRVDSPSEIQDYIEDLGVVMYRTDRKGRTLEEQAVQLKQKMDALASPVDGSTPMGRIESYEAARRTKELSNELSEVETKLRLMDKVFIGFVVAPSIDAKEFEQRARAEVEGSGRYVVTVSSGNRLMLDETVIDLAELTH